MQVSEEQAISFMSGVYYSLKSKIEIFDSQDQDTIDREDLYITSDDRMLCACLEKVLSRAKVNIMFEQEEK